MKGGDDLLSTAEVGKRLGVTRQRVLELITDGRLSARKVGRSYVVRAADVDGLELRKVGRPPKALAQPAKRRGRTAV